MILCRGHESALEVVGSDGWGSFLNTMQKNAIRGGDTRAVCSWRNGTAGRVGRSVRKKGDRGGPDALGLESLEMISADVRRNKEENRHLESGNSV